MGTEIEFERSFFGGCKGISQRKEEEEEEEEQSQENPKLRNEKLDLK